MEGPLRVGRSGGRLGLVTKNIKIGAPYIYEISSLRANIIKWQVKFNPVA